jgi:urease accessory protein
MSLTGAIDLKVAKKQLKTIVSDCYYEGALKITRPVYNEKNYPTIYLIHVGGGYVDGDTYLLNISLEDNAELAVTTQSSTKVYRTPNHPVRQITNINLKKGSMLEFFPDSLIAYEDARFVQETTVRMETGATLFYCDIITPGWSAEGGLFQYDWIRSKLTVFQNGKMVLFDYLFLEHDDDPAGLLKMEGYSHIGSLFIIHQNVNKEFVDSLSSLLTEYDMETRIGFSLLPEEGVALRILALSTGVIEKIIYHVHSFSRKELLDKGPLEWRKY